MSTDQHKRLIGSYKNRELNLSRLQLAKKAAVGRVLDIGCGDGEYIECLENETVGVDILEYSNRSRIIRGDAQNLPFKNDSFGTSLLFEVLEHLPDPKICLQEIQRVTTNKLIMSVPNAIDPTIFEKSGIAMHPFVDPTHVNHYNEEIVRTELRNNGFKNIRIQHINPVKPMKLVLYMFGFGLRSADKLGFYFHKVLQSLPWSETFYMTLLIEADIKK